MRTAFEVIAVLLAVLVLLTLLAHLLVWRVSRSSPPTGAWMDIEGERIHYRSLGQGPALVLVHGLGGESRNFDYLPLADLAQRWRLILVDRPGAGYSPRRDDAHAGLGEQARILAGFIRALHLPQPPLLVGHSLGGAIALRLALQDPGCIAGLALIAPLTHFVAKVPPPFGPMAIRTPSRRRLFARTLAAPLGIAGTPLVMAALFGPDAAPRDFALRGGGLMGLRPSAFYAASTDLAAVERDLPAQQERYGQLLPPVRILYGEGDRVLDWRVQGEALRAKVPQAQLELIPGGHMLPVSAAARTAAWLETAARAALGGMCESPVQPA